MSGRLSLWLGRPNHPTISPRFEVKLDNTNRIFKAVAEGKELDKLMLRVLYSALVTSSPREGRQVAPELAWICDLPEPLYICQQGEGAVDIQDIVSNLSDKIIIKHIGLRKLASDQRDRSSLASAVIYTHLRNGTLQKDIDRVRAKLRQHVLTGNWNPAGNSQPSAAPDRPVVWDYDALLQETVQRTAGQSRRRPSSSPSRSPRRMSVAGGEYQSRLEQARIPSIEPATNPDFQTLRHSYGPAPSEGLAVPNWEGTVFQTSSASSIDLARPTPMYPTGGTEQLVGVPSYIIESRVEGRWIETRRVYSDGSVSPWWRPGQDHVTDESLRSSAHLQRLEPAVELENSSRLLAHQSEILDRDEEAGRG